MTISREKRQTNSDIPDKILQKVSAEALAKNRKLSETSDFFTPALLHDLGKLVLGKFVRYPNL